MLAALTDPSIETLKTLTPESKIFLNSSLIKKQLLTKFSEKTEIYLIPATELSNKKFLTPLFANIILLGYLIKGTGFLRFETVKNVLREEIGGTRSEENISALETGYFYEEEKFERVKE